MRILRLRYNTFLFVEPHLLPWVPEVLLFFLEEQEVKNGEVKNKNLWSQYTVNSGFSEILEWKPVQEFHQE